jgi:signal peptidase I
MKNIGMNIILGLAVLLMLVSMSTYMAPRFGWGVDDVVSGSMAPTLSKGTLVITNRVDPGSIKIGDVIIIDGLPGKDFTICHRVIDIQYGNRTLFITKGDANAVRDSFDVTGQNIAGKVVAHVPVVGNLIFFIKTPLGLAGTLVIPGLLLLALYAVNLRDLFKHKKPDKVGVVIK